MPHTIVIADDVTGANDIGIMYAKAGLDTLVYSYKEDLSCKDCEVLVIDTNSRFDTSENAYNKVAGALKLFQGQKIDQYIDKQCSVFRGNIGAEFDAMLDTLDENFAVVVLGFPNNGRTTLHSLHYVFGTLLEESQFKNDPVHPMTKSDLREILKEQTKRHVDAIHYEIYEKGTDAVKAELEKKRAIGGYCIMDVRDNGDLEMLAEVLKDEKVLCGSSALSEYLAKKQFPVNENAKEKEQTEASGKVLCIAGSLTPQTIGQISYMREKGYPVLELDTRKLFDAQEKETECERVEKEAKNAYRDSSFVLIHSMNKSKQVQETKQLAKENGIDNTSVSSLVSETLAQIAGVVLGKNQIGKIIVCGGDTSASLCAKLNVQGMRVLEEIETGLPTCENVEEPHYKLVLKSGSFGTPGFVEKAYLKLQKA